MKRKKTPFFTWIAIFLKFKICFVFNLNTQQATSVLHMKIEQNVRLTVWLEIMYVVYCFVSYIFLRNSFYFIT